MNRIRPRRRPNRARRDLEPLESRRLMATFTVNSFADQLHPPPGVVTLRSAIEAADSSARADTIVIPNAGIYRTTTIGSATDNSAGEFAINDSGNLTIQNTSGGAVVIDGGGLNRVFDIDPENNTTPFTVTFQGLTITDGVAPNLSGGGIQASGGAGVVLNQCVVTGNVAFNGGGIAMSPTSQGPLTLEGTQVSRNLVLDAGGGVLSGGSGAITIGPQSVIQGNTTLGTTGGGGGILDDGAKMTITGAVIDGNRTSTSGGGILSTGASVSISGSLVEGNVASANGGGFAETSPHGSLVVSDSFFLDNASLDQGGGVSSVGLLASISGSTLTGNSASTGGGAYFSASTALVFGSLVVDNSSFSLGGGLYSQGTTEFDVVGSTVEGNRSLDGNGGGIESDSPSGGNTAINSCLVLGNASGIWGAGADLGGGGTTEVIGSRFTGNGAISVGGGLVLSTGGVINDTTIDANRSADQGGGIYFFLPSGNTISMTDDTVEGNSATGDGGITVAPGGAGTLNLTSDTIDANTALNAGPGGVSQLVGTVVVENTILSGNTAAGSPSDYTYTAGTLTDQGGNLLGTTAGDGGKFGASTIVGDPKLGPLVDNGGPRAGAPSTSQVVPTQALLPGSPAIGKGVASGAPTIDERGFKRPSNPSIGAYEPQYAENASPNTVFVENLYEVLLDRVADPAGLAAAVGFLNAGGSPTTLIQIYQSSTEYLDDEGALLYQRYLGRAPMPTETTAVVSVLKAGSTPEQVAAALIGSNEFFNDFGDDTDVFVEGAFVAALGRATASVAERAAWDAVLNLGTTRAAVGTLLLTTTEYLTDLIDSDFGAYLGRSPTPSDLAAFLDAAKAGVTSPNLAAIALASSFPSRT
jgi:hypothetical protein